MNSKSVIPEKLAPAEAGTGVQKNYTLDSGSHPLRGRDRNDRINMTI